ncbi:MAG: hypothetical protein GY801_16560 [bacterium]|nr:hypothetical protein [bacterium]
MEPKLEQLLNYLEAHIDFGWQQAIEERYRKVLQWEPVERLPIICTYPFPQDAPFQPVPHRQIFDDPRVMLYNELVYAFETSILCHERVGDDLPYTIRPNFGTVLVASLFGAQAEQVEDNPPWVRPFETLEEFQQAIERDPLDFTQGWIPRVAETYQYYHDMLTDYPGLKQVIKIVLPDLQGPIDTVELLRGSTIFMDLYDRPDMVQQALTNVAAAQIGLTRHFHPYISDGPLGFCHQHAVTLPGAMLLRNDSSIMVSARAYRRHIAPHDERVLKELDGSVHSCGKIEHIVKEFLQLPSIRSLDLGQPELNDLDAIYAGAKKRKIPLIRANVPEDELLSGRAMERFPTGVSLKYHASSIQDAKRIMAAYRDISQK